MQLIPQCARCGYATAPAFTRCWCCERPLHRCARTRHHPVRMLWRALRSLRSSKIEKEDLAELIAAW